MQLLLLLGISLLLAAITLAISKIKGIPLKTVAHLLLFGIALSIPFIIVEHWTFNLKFYVVILAFIMVEIAAIFFEKNVKTFHDLIHHNVKHLRIASFILIGVGFTYGEISSAILDSGNNFHELISTVPLKALFGVFIHTVLTSLGSLIHVGGLFAEGILETIFRFASYYLRIIFISLSHYLYVFFIENEFSLYVLPFLVFNIVLFFWIRDYLDQKRGFLPE